MTRFVIRATLRRGVLEAPEPLDEENQYLAEKQAYADALAEARCDCRVVWFPRRAAAAQEKAKSWEYTGGDSTGRVDRMMRLAAGVR